MCVRVGAADANGDRSYPVTGVLERDDLVSQVKLMQQVKPTLKHIVFISDDSVTSQLSGNRIKSLIPSATAETGVMANTTEDFHMVSTVAQFKDVVLRYACVVHHALLWSTRLHHLCATVFADTTTRLCTRRRSTCSLCSRSGPSETNTALALGHVMMPCSSG